MFASGPAKRVWPILIKCVWPAKRVSPAEFEQCFTSKTDRAGFDNQSAHVDRSAPWSQNSKIFSVSLTTSQSVHVAEIPGFQTGEPGPSHRSNKYLKTGPKTRRTAGLAAGVDRPRWLRGLERCYGRAEGGAWPEQNRRWMERERGRRVRWKLPSTPKTNKRKPGRAPGAALRA